LDELLNNGVQHKHNLTISGGGEKSNYYLSAGYSKQFGVVKYADDNNTKYNLRMNYLGEEVTIGIIDRVVRHIQNRLTDYPRSVAAYIGTFIIVQGYFGFQL